MDIENHQILMEILTLNATRCLQTKFEANVMKIQFLAVGPAWAHLGLSDWPMYIQNWQISWRILTLHVTTGLQTKFQENRIKNGSFRL